MFNFLVLEINGCVAGFCGAKFCFAYYRGEFGPCVAFLAISFLAFLNVLNEFVRD